MIRTVLSVRVLQAVAVIAGLAVLFWSLGFPSFHLAEAANLTSVSDTLSDSAPNVPANHTLSFTTPNGVAAGETVVVTFPASSFDPSGLDFEDFDLATTSDLDLAASESGETWGVSTDATSVTFTSETGVIPANATVTIEMGTNATFGAAGDTQITNPASSSYAIDIAAGTEDTGTARVVILDNVEVTASVDTTFSFSVAGVGGGQSVNGTTTTGASTATAIPFGTLLAGAASTTAQDLTVSTNASQGYSVTVQIDQPLLSSTGADIDGFVDGSYTDTPTAWASPSETLGDEDTYGHWGMTSEDATTTRSAEFGSDEWVSASTSPRVVMSHAGPSDGTTQGVGSARVGYQIEITALQEAGDDYSTTLTYVATPTF